MCRVFVLFMALLTQTSPVVLSALPVFLEEP